MSTIFEHIGFHITGEEDVYRLADFVLNAGKIFLVKDGFYVCWVNESGSEVWCRMALDHKNKKTTLLNIDPHYNGQNIWKLKLGRELSGEEDDFLDGKFVLYTEDERQFITARVMGVQSLSNFTEGNSYYFQVAFIPHIVRFFENEEAYREEQQDKEIILGVCFPRGMYSRMVVNAVEDEEQTPEDILMTRLVCQVRSCELRRIELDGKKLGGFYHLVVDTQFGPLDVASKIESAPGEVALLIGTMAAKVVPEPNSD